MILSKNTEDLKGGVCLGTVTFHGVASTNPFLRDPPPSSAWLSGRPSRNGGSQNSGVPLEKSTTGSGGGGGGDGCVWVFRGGRGASSGVVPKLQNGFNICGIHTFPE